MVLATTTDRKKTVVLSQPENYSEAQKKYRRWTKRKAPLAQAGDEFLILILVDVYGGSRKSYKYKREAVREFRDEQRAEQAEKLRAAKERAELERKLRKEAEAAIVAKLAEADEVKADEKGSD